MSSLLGLQEGAPLEFGSGPVVAPEVLPLGTAGRARTPVAQAERATRSSANQATLPLMDEDVGDDRGTPRSHPAARCLIPGLQFLEFLPTRRVRQQGLQFLLSLGEIFLRSHGSSSLKRDRRRSPQRGGPRLGTRDGEWWRGPPRAI